MKVSLVQMNSINDKAANIAAARALIERAVAEESPDWVLLPEQFDWAGGAKGDKARNAETLPDGPAYAMAQELAAKHGIFLHAGSFMEKIEGDERIHNTSVVFDREGREIARYRKIHLFDVTAPDGVSYKESATVKPGDLVVTYDCEGVKVGCTICYDLRFPGLFQALADRGAEMVAVPCCAPVRSKRKPMSARPRRPERSRSTTRPARPTAIRSSPTPGASSSPRRRMASAWYPRGSTWRWSNACAR
jgi:nitrilase